jgi:hypothetical protein
MGQRLALFIGLAVGLLGGLVYAWSFPGEIYNAGPWMMRPEYRKEWVRLTALSYVVDQDLERALWRLSGGEEAMPLEDVADAMATLIDEHAAAGRPADTMRRLTVLAQELGVQTPAMLVYLDLPPITETPTATPLPSSVPTLPVTPTVVSTVVPTTKPTRTPYPPTATPGPPSLFQFASKEQVCVPGETPHIEIIVQNELGDGLVGVHVWLMWLDGSDRAITGLKPEKGLGYADFSAEEGIEYSLGTSELGAPLATGLRLEPCPEEKGKEPIIGSWRIVLARKPLATEIPSVTPAE